MSQNLNMRIVPVKAGHFKLENVAHVIAALQPVDADENPVGALIVIDGNPSELLFSDIEDGKYMPSFELYDAAGAIMVEATLDIIVVSDSEIEKEVTTKFFIDAEFTIAA